MKKNKAKKKKASSTKHLKKALISKLEIAFKAVVSEFGKAKKSTNLIEKFAKELSKKVNLVIQDDVHIAKAKEEEISTVQNEKPVSTVAKRKPPVKPVAQKKTETKDK